MPTTKELEDRVAALESQMRILTSNSAIQSLLDFDRQDHARREIGRREKAALDAQREQSERELQAANVVWIEATVAPNAKQLRAEMGMQYLEWAARRNQYRVLESDRLDYKPNPGRIRTRADVWAARLARESELAALVNAGEIAVRELPREEAIDLERAQRIQEAR